jgi:phage baseplate assembly protein W
MGYRVQPIQTNFANDNIALGIEVRFDNAGVFTSVYSTEQQALNSLKNLLLTRIGERYENPTYGTNLLDIIFQPNIDELKSDIIDIITIAVNRWLPEITLENIDVTTNESDPTLNSDVKVSITISVKERIFSIVINANETGQLTVEAG